MAKEKINKNTMFEDEDTDIERDMKTLGQMRDVLFNEFKATNNVSDKLNISNQISALVHARQQSEMLFLRIAGYFDRNEDDDGDYCEGCPECETEMQKGNDEAN